MYGTVSFFLTAKQGCILSIGQGSKSGKVEDNGCSNDVDVGSASIELKISHPCSSTNFKHPVEISLYGKVSLVIASSWMKHN